MGAEWTKNGRERTGLSPAQAVAMAQLLALKSSSEAAKEAGVGADVVSKWKRQPGPFRDEYRRAKAAIYAEAEDRMKLLSVEAVEVLASEMRNPQATPSERIRAAVSILDRVVADAVEPEPEEVSDEVLAAFVEELTGGE